MYNGIFFSKMTFFRRHSTTLVILLKSGLFITLFGSYLAFPEKFQPQQQMQCMVATKVL